MLRRLLSSPHLPAAAAAASAGLGLCGLGGKQHFADECGITCIAESTDSTDQGDARGFLFLGPS